MKVLKWKSDHYVLSKVNNPNKYIGWSLVYKYNLPSLSPSLTQENNSH